MASPGLLLVCSQLRAKASELPSSDHSSRLLGRASRINTHSIITELGFRVVTEFEGLRRYETPVVHLSSWDVHFYSLRAEDTDVVELAEGRVVLRTFLPPPQLDATASELYQVLRHDGVLPERALELVSAVAP